MVFAGKGPMKFNLKRLLEFERKEVFALDIGSSAVKVVQMHKDDGGYAVTAAGMTEIGAECDEVGQGNVSQAVRKCLESTGIRTRMAVCGVSGPDVAVRYFRFPPLAPEEIEGAVLLEAAQVCPFNTDNGAVDYQLIPNAENIVQGVLVAATNKVIERKKLFAKEASLECVLMDVDGLALLNCFCKYEMPGTGRTTAILNIGSSYTTLAIIGSNALPFIRDIACAGNEIARQVADEMGLSIEDVKEILGDREGLSETQPEFGESLDRACRKLIVDVNETLRYYAAQEKAATIERIFVCGGFALVSGFVELLNRRLSAEVELWNPFEKIRCEAEKPYERMLRKNGPAMAVAAGLAMRSI
jgi:type IV pilus assembly protein PilM